VSFGAVHRHIQAATVSEPFLTSLNQQLIDKSYISAAVCIVDTNEPSGGRSMFHFRAVEIANDIFSCRTADTSNNLLSEQLAGFSFKLS
jgi:hypothetical protein